MYGTLQWQEYWVGQDDKVEVREWVPFTVGKPSLELILRRPRGGQDVDHLGLLGTSGQSPPRHETLGS